jgi:archaellum biogenesis ATPase FlaH
MTHNLESMEPKFFAYILEHPHLFHRVDAHFFKVPNLSRVYQIVREHYLTQKNPIVPNPKKIKELVRLQDPANTITNEYLMLLLTIDISEYKQGNDDNWLSKSINSWIVFNGTWGRIYEAADEIRNINPIDYQNVELVTTKIRNLVTSATVMDFDNAEMGKDFDNPEHHVQDVERNKIPTGWNSLDELTNGGWDFKTLNVIIGPSNSGKSLWLSNIAANTMAHGKNVVYFTLEMSETKILKRIGSIALKIPIGEYDTLSKDTRFMQEKLKDFRSRSANLTSDGDLFNTEMGKLHVKEFPAGTATIADLDNYIKHLQDTRKYKVDMVIVDYITIMKPDQNGGNLFQNGKQLAEGLRAIGQKHNLSVITAMQVGKDNFGAGDISMSDISESKAIAETADTMWGIIRSEIMRAENKYILKLLKIRDGGFPWTKTHFHFNDKYLSLENDKKMFE